MANIPDIKLIRTEDFDSDDQRLVNRLAESINTFMEETRNAFSKNIDFNNLAQFVKTVAVKMGTGGSPANNLVINTGTTRKILGISVINAIRVDVSSSYVESHPFINFTQQSQSVIKVNNISGLQDNSEYQLTLVMFT